MTTSVLPPYIADLVSYRRRPTRIVSVGSVDVGGSNPIRVQSMTTTLTKDVAATIDQAERLARAGCEIVRVTTPTPADARCLGPIREGLARRGIHVPLVADIHFSPQAAMVAAEYADKVRVNPGNYVDSRKFAVREYSDSAYGEEVERAAERFAPLVLKCKERGIAMRIGTNHGSLSDRIMNRFGDTPEGMVESALEFVRVCEAYEFHSIILSMKASNPKVMIAAYRLLALRMAEEGMDYPFHLGVTEAGNAEDGRIKSAVGIGSLLEDGIGDTIRVSLTEEPEEEIPVARAIATRYPSCSSPPERESPPTIDAPWDPIHYRRRNADTVRIGQVSVGSDETVGVIVPLSVDDKMVAHLLRWASPAGRRQPKPDAVYVELTSESDLGHLAVARARLKSHPGARLAVIAGSSSVGLLLSAISHIDAVQVRCVLGEPIADILGLGDAAQSAGVPVILSAPSGPHLDTLLDSLISTALALESRGVSTVLTLETGLSPIHDYRRVVIEASRRGLRAPLILQVSAPDSDSLDALLSPSIHLGSLLCDGIGDVVMVWGADDPLTLAFNILQATGARISKTDYVACPSCGRTLFDLQETTERIKARTSHLVGVKLAIMGCIVNGPGEMADADFGYVGGAPGRVNLYVGRECVEKGVPADEADDRLIELIKAHGKWEEEVEDEPALAPA
ncbi:MAG TPA: (E)-4-hydroxy-3-methylbut-2-enyl-diphosphate synthase [Chloroflexota bacterium]|nr:(E)-4-hydroxy-3-methylbut-2-enyl-diphosphate synthase [Chloroflexota bacterium]